MNHFGLDVLVILITLLIMTLVCFVYWLRFVLDAENKCIECGKIAYMHKRSRLTLCAIHANCHSRSIQEAMKGPALGSMIRAELNDFESSTGIDTSPYTRL